MAQKVREYPALNPTSLLCVSDQYPPSIKGPDVIKAYMGQTTVVNYTSNAKDITFTLRENCTDFKLFGKNTGWGLADKVRVKLWVILHYYILCNFVSLLHWNIQDQHFLGMIAIIQIGAPPPNPNE